MKKTKRFSIILFLLIVFFFNSTLLRAQQQDSIIVGEMKDLMELKDDDYVEVAREGRPTSPAYRYFGPNFSVVQVNVNEAGENILGDAANEPSIAIDPNDPDRMVIGWRQFDTISSNFRQAGFAYSNDGGDQWIFPGVIEPGVFRSDPVLDYDTEGNFYYNSLTNATGGFTCNVFKSTGDGTWDEGSFAYGGDKQWMVIDRTGGIGHGNIYSFWAQAFSSCSPGFFTRSVDGNVSYEDCITIPQSLRRGTLAIGPDGSVYACGHVNTQFYVAKSTNAQDESEAIVWDFTSEVFLDGELERAAGPNPSGMLGQVWIATDHSGGPTHGNVYLLCSVRRFSNNDVLDVMFSRSTDGGLSWSDPVRINDDTDPNAWQWFGTLSVAPNGRIDVAWVDTRDDPGGLNSSLYISHSEDGGLSWTVNERLSDSFDPLLGFPQQNKIGDYYEMISDNEGAHLTWSATFNGEQDVYYSYIPYELVSTEEIAQEKVQSFQNKPNPFSGQTEISYELAGNGFVELRVYDVLGQELASLVSERQTPGEYVFDWTANAEPGIYFGQLSIDGLIVATQKMIKLE